MSVSVGVTERNHHAVVKVRGEVDLSTSPRLRDTLVDLTDEPDPHVIVDLDDVGFIDSTGIGVLVGGVKRARSQGGDLALVCTQRRILKVLEITGLTSVFGVHDTIEHALSPAI